MQEFFLCFVIFFILDDFSKSCLLLINLNKDLKVKLNGLVYTLSLIKEDEVMTKAKNNKEIRFEKEAKALLKNLEKRKKQQAEREKLQKTKEVKNGQD